LVEWETNYPANYATWDGDTSKADTALPAGLYNMVVMVYDVSLDYSVNSSDPVENAVTMAPYLERRQDPRNWYNNGTYHNQTVYDVRYQKEFVYKSMVPLDYMLYLYTGPFKFCNKGCADNKDIEIEASIAGTTNPATDNYPDGTWSNGFNVGGTWTPAYPGVETFADYDGVYGYSTRQAMLFEHSTDAANFDTAWLYDLVAGTDTAPEYPLAGSTDKTKYRRSQMCTICQYPDNSGVYGGIAPNPDNTTNPDNYGILSNRTDCIPFNNENHSLPGQSSGLCSAATGTDSVLPLAAACIENRPPTFGQSSSGASWIPAADYDTCSHASWPSTAEGSLARKNQYLPKSSVQANPSVDLWRRNAQFVADMYDLDGTPRLQGSTYGEQPSVTIWRNQVFDFWCAPRSAHPAPRRSDTPPGASARSGTGEKNVGCLKECVVWALNWLTARPTRRMAGSRRSTATTAWSWS
jgi:hypothetical protein